MLLLILFISGKKVSTPPSDEYTKLLQTTVYSVATQTSEPQTEEEDEEEEEEEEGEGDVYFTKCDKIFTNIEDYGIGIGSDIHQNPLFHINDII